MRTMVKSGEVDALVPERVWKELVRALGEDHPALFFKVLSDCDASLVLFEEIQLNGPGIAALIKVTMLTEDTQIRFAALLHDCSIDHIQALCERYRVPTDYRDLRTLSLLSIMKHISKSSIN